jgi:hypothetical protein
MSLKCELMPDYYEATKAALNSVPLDGPGVFVLYQKTTVYTAFRVKTALKMRSEILAAASAYPGPVYVPYAPAPVSDLPELQKVCEKELNL